MPMCHEIKDVSFTKTREKSDDKFTSRPIAVQILVDRKAH